MGLFTLRTEPPIEQIPYRVPECPVCGEETDTVYKDRWGNVVGCPACVQEASVWLK